MNKIYITIIVVLLGTTAFGGYKWYQFNHQENLARDVADAFNGLLYVLEITQGEFTGEKFVMLPNGCRVMNNDEVVNTYGNEYTGRFYGFWGNKVTVPIDEEGKVRGAMIQFNCK